MSILTKTEAILTLKEDASTIDNGKLVDDLAAIDDYIFTATGYVAATPVNPRAKKLARMLLIQWWDNPDGRSDQKSSDYGVAHLVAQLRATVSRLADAEV